MKAVLTALPGAALTLALLAGGAWAQTCGPLADAEGVLAQKYGERPLPGDWRAEDGHRIVFTGSEPRTSGEAKGRATWTMLIVAGGKACVVMSGTVLMPSATSEPEEGR